MTYARSLFLFSSATIGELLVVIEILMNSGTKKYYEKYKNIYDSRNLRGVETLPQYPDRVFTTCNSRSCKAEAGMFFAAIDILGR